MTFPLPHKSFRFWIGMKFGKSVWNFIVVSCKLKANFVSDWQYISCKEQRNILEKAFLSLSATSGRKLTNLMANAGTSVIYCKTVGFFFLKSVKKSLKRGVRVARASHAGLSPVSLSVFRLVPDLWLLARTWISKSTHCFAVYYHKGVPIFQRGLVHKSYERNKLILQCK